MFGNKWELVSADVAEVLGDQGAGPVYTVVVGRPKGGDLRGQVTALPGMAELAAGTRVRLEVNHKTGELRFNPQHVQMTPISGPYQPGGVQVSSTATIQFGDGPPVQVAGPMDSAALMQSLLRGSPADRRAARDQLRALTDQAKAAHAAGQPAGFSPEAAQVFGSSTAAGAAAGILLAAAQAISQTQGGPGAASGPVGPYRQGQGGPVGPYSQGQPVDPYQPEQGTFNSPADVFGASPESDSADAPAQPNWAEQQQAWLDQQGRADEDQPREQF